MKQIKAPIDNKNILEDFTDIFHDGDCLETRNKKEVKQAFYLSGKLFQIQYVFGLNAFHIECYDTLQNMDVVYTIRELVESMNTDEINVVYSDCGIDRKYSLSGLFYYNNN